MARLCGLQKIRNEEIGNKCEEYVNLKERCKELGKGGFGKVYKYKQPDTEQRLAIKMEERVCIYYKIYLAVNLFYSVHWLAVMAVYFRRLLI